MAAYLLWYLRTVKDSNELKSVLQVTSLREIHLEPDAEIAEPWLDIFTTGAATANGAHRVEVS